MSELFNDLVTGLNEAIEFEKGKGKARTHTFIRPYMKSNNYILFLKFHIYCYNFSINGISKLLKRRTY